MTARAAVWKGGDKGATFYQWRKSLVDRGGDLAGLTYAKITPERVNAFLEPLSVKEANRVRSEIDEVLKYMLTGQLQKVMPKVKHFASVAYDKVPAVMAALAEDDTDASRVLRFIVLTAARVGEVNGDMYGKVPLKWREIAQNGDGWVWTCPAARMKNKRDHRVPLSATALALIGDKGADDDNVFPIHSSAPLNKLRERLHITETVHGFRSSFETWAVETGAADKQLAECALSHYPGDATTYGAYMRGDLFERRRKLMEEWAAYATGR
jgi:integrase